MFMVKELYKVHKRMYKYQKTMIMVKYLIGQKDVSVKTWSVIQIILLIMQQIPINLNKWWAIFNIL